MKEGKQNFISISYRKIDKPYILSELSQFKYFGLLMVYSNEIGVMSEQLWAQKLKLSITQLYVLLAKSLN